MTGNRPKLSSCIIARDNAEIIESCLVSIRPWVDEMIVVDTGSRDNTPEIARRLGAKVSNFPWPDSFSIARNESLRLASGEWLFWMDSDDIIDERNGRALRNLAYSAHQRQIAGYVIQVHCPDARDKDDLHIVDHVKLFRNHPAIRFEHRIHEQVLMPIRRLGAEIGLTDIFVVHANADQTTEGRKRKSERDLRLLQLDLQDFPDHPFVLFNFGMTYNYLERHAEAIPWLERCIILSQGESHLRKAYAILVHSLTDVSRLDDALATSRVALGLFPEDAELLFRQGLLLHRMGRIGEAIQSYRGVLCNGAERFLHSRCEGITGYKARNNLAIVYGEVGAHSMAEFQWRVILDEKPSYHRAWKALGESLLRQHKLFAAELLVEHMLADGNLRCDGLTLRAELAFLAGDRETGIAIYGDAIRNYPESTDLLETACQSLFEHDALDEAERALTELDHRIPEVGATLHNLGLVKMRKGNVRGAINYFERSLEVRPGYPLTQQQLADAREAMTGQIP